MQTIQLISVFPTVLPLPITTLIIRLELASSTVPKEPIGPLSQILPLILVSHNVLQDTSLIIQLRDVSYLASPTANTQIL